MIKAVTFDCWDTLIVDARSCESRQKERLSIILQGHGFQFSLDELDDAFQRENKLRQEYVVEQRKTKNALQRLETVLKLLEVSLPLAEMVSIADFSDRVILESRPSPVPKVREVLAVLDKDFQLAVICNTGWHSAGTIKEILDGHDLMNFFDCFSFSDEIGVAKPHPRIFQVTLDKLRCSPKEAVHIGDAEYSDIVGAKGVKMHTILFTGVNYKYKDNNTADIVVDAYDNLPAILKEI